jgi:tRNA threonylcarbamoyl adenosine modification protein YeaZ
MTTQNQTPLILAIETATRAGSVSLLRHTEVLATIIGDAESSHSTDLLENIDHVLRSGRTKLTEIDVFAVASGPGSFTGLRIGLATAKALAENTTKRCVGIPTLKAIAHAAGLEGDRRVVALLTAGRGELFAQMFTKKNGSIKSLDVAAHISPDVVLQTYGSIASVTWAGEGAYKYVDTLNSWAERNRIVFHRATSPNADNGWVLAPECNQLATSVALLAREEYRRERTVLPQELRANYVRPSDAEIPKNGNTTANV